MILAVGYALKDREKTVAGQVVTIKPEKALWEEADLEGNSVVKLDLKEEELQAISANMAGFKVDSLSDPTAIIPV